MSPELPFPKAYWPIPGELLAGCFPGHREATRMDEKLAGLVRAGVTLSVNLMEEGELDRSGALFVSYADRLSALGREAGREIRMRRFPVRDNCIPSPAVMLAALEGIEDEIANGGVVYVHCLGGKGRTATVVGCFLLRRQLTTSETVLRDLESLTAHESDYFWPTPRTEEQRLFVQGWARCVDGGGGKCFDRPSGLY